MTKELNGAVGCDPVFFQSRRAAYGYFAFGYSHSSHQELSNGPGTSDRLAQSLGSSVHAVRILFPDDIPEGRLLQVSCQDCSAF